MTKTKNTFILSSEKRNSHGFITRTDGINLARMKKNPVMLFNHHSDLVLGKWENLRVENGQLLGDAVFDEKDTFAMAIKRKVDEGFLRATSVSLKIDDMDLENSEVVAKKSELMEASIVSVPANDEALKQETMPLSVTLFAGSSAAVTEKIQHLLSQNKKPNMENLKLLQLTTFLSLHAQATEQEIINQIKSREQALNAEKEALSKELADLRAAQEQAITQAKEQLLAGAVGDKRISEAEKNVFAKLSLEDVRTIIEGRKPTAKSLQAQMEAKAKTASRADWNFERWSKEDAKGLQEMKLSAPEAYQKLYDDTYKQA